MSAPVLDLLARLLEEVNHNRHVARLTVTPVAYPSFAQDSMLVEAALERFDGVLVDATTSAVAEVRGQLKSDRVAILKGLVDGSGVLPSPAVFAQRGDNVVVELETGMPHDGSTPVVLKVLEVLASDLLDRRSILAVAAPTALADADRDRLLAQLLSQTTVELLAPRETCLLVPILADPPDIVASYDRVPEVRFVIRADRLLVRDPPEQRALDLQLVVPNRDRALVLFLGAGASASAGVELGNTYRDAAFDELLGGDQATHPERFYDFLHGKDRFLPGEAALSPAALHSGATLERVLREVFHRQNPRPRAESATIKTLVKDCSDALMQFRPGRRALHELIPLLSKLVVVTINFDELIENGLAAPHEVFVEAERYSDAADVIRRRLGGGATPAPILKLHGTASDPETLVANIDETDYGLAGEVRDALNVLVEDYPITWVWIGCSMRDRDVNAWLGGLGAGVLDEWWVDPLPGQSLDEFVAEYRRARWQQDNRRLDERLFLTSSDVFFHELRNHVVAL
ncbi:MAG TPA: SIR2 family protein [Solirubrobacteraceae bacterium]|jgi:hypothetical protein